MSDDLHQRTMPHERQTDSSLHPSHVDTGGVEMYESDNAIGTDAAVVYYQGVVGKLNHEGDFSGVQVMKKHAPSREHDGTPLHRPDQWIPQIVVNGTANDVDLPGMVVRSVVIHNYTPQFAYLPDLRMWVDPFRLGLVMRVPASLMSNIGRIAWSQPPGFTQPSLLAGAVLIALWTEAELAPDAGAVILGHP